MSVRQTTADRFIRCGERLPFLGSRDPVLQRPQVRGDLPAMVDLVVEIAARDDPPDADLTAESPVEDAPGEVLPRRVGEQRRAPRPGAHQLGEDRLVLPTLTDQGAAGAGGPWEVPPTSVTAGQPAPVLPTVTSSPDRSVLRAVTTSGISGSVS